MDYVGAGLIPAPIPLPLAECLMHEVDDEWIVEAIQRAMPAIQAQQMQDQQSAAGGQQPAAGGQQDDAAAMQAEQQAGQSEMQQGQQMHQAEQADAQRRHEAEQKAQDRALQLQLAGVKARNAVEIAKARPTPGARRWTERWHFTWPKAISRAAPRARTPSARRTRRADRGGTRCWRRRPEAGRRFDRLQPPRERAAGGTECDAAVAAGA